MSNVGRAQHILQWFEALGVADICICPGGRNAPFVFALENSKKFKITSAFDERAAGFFAFGRAYSGQKPAVVITTSGTAAAELLPSVIEAHYSQAPLIVVTADRPQHLRGTGSPQVINQLNIFGSYVESCVDVDWDQSWSAPQWKQEKPLHINISFEEPLLDAPLKDGVPIALKNTVNPAPASYDVAKHLKAWTAPGLPLLVVGPLHKNEVEKVQHLCQSWPGIQYVEAASGLRECELPGKLVSGEKYVSKLLKQNALSGVLRVGGVPTLKLWRELEAASVPVLSISSRPFAGLARGEFAHVHLAQWTPKPFDLSIDASLKSKVIEGDRNLYLQQTALLKKYPESEPSWVQSLSQRIPASDRIYIGNSLPIRQWDAFASYQQNQHLAVNRGANGIDGQIASAIGMCSSNEELSVVIGDLTALYDATGFWFKDAVKTLRVFVINNNGGRIFERLFKNAAFYNSHDVRFQGLAALWNIPYTRLESQSAIAGEGLFEIVPDAEQTQKFWEEYDQLFR